MNVWYHYSKGAIWKDCKSRVWESGDVCYRSFSTIAGVFWVEVYLVLWLSFSLMFTRQNRYTLGSSYMLLKHAYGLRFLCLHNSEDTQLKLFWIVVWIVQWFFYTGLKLVSVNFVVTKMYQIRPYPCTSCFLRDGMTLGLLAHWFESWWPWSLHLRLVLPLSYILSTRTAFLDEQKSL